MTITPKPIMIVIAILIGAIIYLQINLQHTKNELVKSKAQIQINYQNAQAYKDSVNMQKDTIQTYSLSIKDLRNENSKLNAKATYLKSQFTILLDSIKVLNKPAVVDTSIKDTNKIVITFQGHEGHITYKGQVIYFKLTKTATHSIDITQDPIKIVSIIFLDKKTNLIKDRIYADGTLINDAHTEIDSLIYMKLNGPQANVNTINNFWDTFSFIAEINQRVAYDKVQQQWTMDRFSFNLGFGYYFSRNLSIQVKKDMLNNSWSGGIRYEITPYRLFKSIF